MRIEVPILGAGYALTMPPTAEMAADLGAIPLTNDAGSGYMYFKLRDLGEALGFTVDWSVENGIYIEMK